MRILLLAPGQSVHSQRLATMLLDCDQEVVFLDAVDPQISTRANYRFVQDRLCPLRGQKYRLVRLVDPWIKAIHLRRVWAQIRPDVINVHWVDRRALYCATARLRPLVLTCWGSDINNLFGTARVDPETRRRVASALACADCATADSGEVIARCKELAGAGLRTERFFFGIDTNKFKPGSSEETWALRSKLGIPRTARVILSCRRVHPTMGHDYVLEAFAELVRNSKNPEPVLVFKRYLADSGEVEGVLRRKAEALSLGGRVFWLEPSSYDEVPLHYLMADVVVNYPERDAVPVSLFEAAACKRVIISSNLPAYQDVFGDSLLAVEPANPRALAAALSAVLSDSDPGARARVDKAFTIAQKLGSLSANVERLIDIFGSLRAGGTRQGELIS